MLVVDGEAPSQSAPNSFPFDNFPLDKCLMIVGQVSETFSINKLLIARRLIPSKEKLLLRPKKKILPLIALISLLCYASPTV